LLIYSKKKTVSANYYRSIQLGKFDYLVVRWR